jgi:hypothetical protein
MAKKNQPGCCGCGGGACASPTFTGSVTACFSLSAAGVTIEAHDATSGGTLLGSTTTDSSGNYTLTGLTGQIVGNAIVLVFKFGARFTTTTTSLAYTAGTPSTGQWSCGASTSTGSRTMGSAASGYHCYPGCAIPLPDTLSYTDANGTVTMTYSAGSWKACSTKTSMTTVVTSVPASCAPTTGTASVPYYITLSDTSTGQLEHDWCQYTYFGGTNTYTSDGTGNNASCSTSTGMNCPVRSGCTATSTGIATVTPTKVCPPSLSLSGTIGDGASSPNPGNGSFTITE